MSTWKEVTRGVTWAVLSKPGTPRQHIVLTFRIQQDPETSAFVGLCEELEVSSYGSSVAEAIDNVVEATLLYLNTVESQGQRRRVFDQGGIDIRQGAPSDWHDEQRQTDDAEEATVQPSGVVTTRILVSQG